MSSWLLNRLKMLLRKMPLLKVITKISNKIEEKESKEVNTVVTIVEEEEAVADLARMKTVSSLSKAKTKSQEEIIAVDVVEEVAVADAEEAIVKTNKIDQRVSKSSRSPNRRTMSRRMKRNPLLPRSQLQLLRQNQ